jgi:hypothetical protein
MRIIGNGWLSRGGGKEEDRSAWAIILKEAPVDL